MAKKVMGSANPCSCCGSKAKIEIFTITIYIAEADYDFLCCSNKDCQWYWCKNANNSQFTEFDNKTGKDSNGHAKPLWDYATAFAIMAEHSLYYDGAELWNRLHPIKAVPEKVYDPIGSLEL